MKQGKEARLYRIWVSMKNRCQNPHNYSYCNYGGRGIEVCLEWQDYAPFAKWAMSHGYTDELTIERIDNNGPYAPTNCKWATRREQNLNTRANRLLTFDGKTMPMSMWAEETGIPASAIVNRLKKGWSIEQALTVHDGKLNQAVKYTYNGETHSLRQWADILGIRKGTLKNRIRLGMPISQVFSPNKRLSTKYLTYGDETLSVRDWAKRTGLSADQIHRRLYAGWSVEKTLSTPNLRSA